MKIRERVEFINHNQIQPQQIMIILIIMLSSLSLGLIPIIFQFSSNVEQNQIIPTEAQLWNE